MLGSIRRILYATDMGKTASVAFTHVARLAALTGADIYILHVVPELSEDARFTIQTFILDAHQRHQIIGSRFANARSRLDADQDAFWAKAEAQDPGSLKVRDQIKEIEVCEGYPADQILRYARRQHCDLIVMGAHEKGLTHTFLGDVAHKVLRRSRIPTLIVPLPEDD